MIYEQVIQNACHKSEVLTLDYYLRGIDTVEVTLEDFSYESVGSGCSLYALLAQVSNPLRHDFLHHALRRRFILTFDDYETLNGFVSSYASLALPPFNNHIVRVEVNITGKWFNIRKKEEKWRVCKRPHMHHKRSKFKRMFCAMQSLPANYHVYIYFRYFWRDFNMLRIYAEKYLRGVNLKGIRFGSTHPRIKGHNWLAWQTIAALTDQEPLHSYDFRSNNNIMRHGCTGINWYRPSVSQHE